MKNIEMSTLATGSDSYAIGSTTKMFTATSILQLSEQGLLSLNDPVTKYIPEETVNNLTKGNALGLQVKHLLGHASGIGDYITLPGGVRRALEIYGTNRSVIYTPQQLLDYTYEYSQPAFTVVPPASYDDIAVGAYSNTGYIMLGIIIEQVSGMSWEDFTDKGIFQPAAMSESGFVTLGAPSVTGYAHGMWEGPVAMPPTLAWSAGGMYSTPRDLALFMRKAVHGELFASKETLHTWLRGQPTAINGMPYGYGIVNMSAAGILLIGHPGQTFGFQCGLWYDPESDTVYVLIANDSMFDLFTAAFQLKRILDTEWPAANPSSAPTTTLVAVNSGTTAGATSSSQTSPALQAEPFRAALLLVACMLTY